jgi:hypothetical protein
MGDVTNVAIVGTVQKNGHQVLRVSMGNCADRPYVYARIYEDASTDDPRHPGLSMRPDIVRELLPLLA